MWVRFEAVGLLVVKKRLSRSKSRSKSKSKAANQRVAVKAAISRTAKWNRSLRANAMSAAISMEAVAPGLADRAVL